MKNESLKNSLSVLAGIVLIVLTVGGFLLIWRQAQSGDRESFSQEASAKYPVVDIDLEQQFAAELVQNKTNLADMPIKAPDSDKVGRDNPFAGL
ncbi:MAG TPA: hypothetical protein PK263_05580 [bacterium]|nr:hypothetical protein [bacterium]